MRYRPGIIKEPKLTTVIQKEKEVKTSGGRKLIKFGQTCTGRSAQKTQSPSLCFFFGKQITLHESKLWINWEARTYAELLGWQCSRMEIFMIGMSHHIFLVQSLHPKKFIFPCLYQIII